MNIKERIKSISEYFKQMQITTVDDGSQVIYVEVAFPRGWIIGEEIEEKFGVQILEGNNKNEYFFCADIELGEDVLFDAIEYNIDKMKEAIERAKLLSEKTKEITNIFKDESITIDQLRSLKFVYESEKAEEKPLLTTKKENKEKTDVKDE